ncbi:MAG TPA: hypothetical protein VFQ52_03470 [Rhizomicrobium sp.]|nr:hypothetical protein [Rhizomicrobium sp.]
MPNAASLQTILAEHRHQQGTHEAEDARGDSLDHLYGSGNA